MGPRISEDIPLRDWRRVLIGTWKEFGQDQIPAVAAGATFYCLLALFPALAAFVSLYGLFADVEGARKQVLALHGLLPEGAIEVVGDQMVRLTGANHAGLGLTFLISLLVSLWSANAGVKAVMAGLNVAYEEEEKRNFLRLNVVSLGLTVGSTLFSVAAVAGLVALPATPPAEWIRWPALLAVITIMTSVLYRFGPSREHPPWRWITPGSVVASAGWMIMSLLFTTYVGHFGSYNKTYGSLGAIVGFMTWIWMSLMVMLLGAELNSELEKQRPG
jgi:membrane protein